MNKDDIMGIVSMLMADTDSIRVLVAEVGEGLEPNGCDYSKLHAVYEIAENQERMMSHRHEAGTAKDCEHRQWRGQRGDNPRKQEENSMANTLSKDGLQKLHAPLVYLIGGKDDIAYPNASDDFNRLSQVPVAMANLPVGHMGTYNEDHGGEFAKVALLWLDWQLKGKGKGKSFFLGTEADRSAYPGWTVETKNF